MRVYHAWNSKTFPFGFICRITQHIPRIQVKRLKNRLVIWLVLGYPLSGNSTSQNRPQELIKAANVPIKNTPASLCTSKFPPPKNTELCWGMRGKNQEGRADVSRQTTKFKVGSINVPLWMLIVQDTVIPLLLVCILLAEYGVHHSQHCIGTCRIIASNHEFKSSSFLYKHMAYNTQKNAANDTNLPVWACC